MLIWDISVTEIANLDVCLRYVLQTDIDSLLQASRQPTLFSAMLLGYYLIENKRRDRKSREMGEKHDTEGSVEELSNLADREMLSFRDVL